MSCLFCKIVNHHKNEVKRIIEKDAKNRQKINDEKFQSISICTIKTPEGEKPMCLKDIEEMYIKNFPGWDTNFQCFPEHPIFYDLLFKKSPSTRAIDIEKKVENLEKLKMVISKTPFDIQEDSDIDIVTKASIHIVESLQPVIGHLNLGSNPRIINGVPKVLNGKLRSKLKELKDSTKVMSTMQELQHEGFEMVLTNDKTSREEKGYYEMRIGDMGEFSTINAIKPIMKDVPSFCVRGLKLSEHLGKELKKLGINFGKEDAEMDIVNISCNNDKLNVMFGECKVLQDTRNTSADRIMKKVKESLSQTTRDLQIFFKMFPDITVENLKKMKFTTLSILPATLSQHLTMCADCRELVVFREDLNLHYGQFDSLAELLHADMTHKNMPENETSLSLKLQVEKSTMPPTEVCLGLLKMISSRLVGIGSLYFQKTYGPTKSHLGAINNMLQEMNSFASDHLETALYLSPEQIQAMKKLNFVITGFHGVGKTTILEVAVDNIAERFACPKIIFIAWDESEELKKMFEEKFEKLKNHFQESACLEVFSLEEACDKYQVKLKSEPESNSTLDTDDLKKDDMVVLSNDEQFVKSEFNQSTFKWDDTMRLMLGETFPLLEIIDDRTVALPPPGASQDSKWYFPKSVVTRIVTSAIPNDQQNSMKGDSQDRGPINSKPDNTNGPDPSIDPLDPLGHWPSFKPMTTSGKARSKVDVLNDLCKKLRDDTTKDEYKEQAQDIFLLLDEVPWNIEQDEVPLNIEGRAVRNPSGDWRDLTSNGIHLMMALKPFENSTTHGSFGCYTDGDTGVVDLHFPEELEHVKLKRIFRCTQNIAKFYNKVVKGLNNKYRNFATINSSANSYVSGHEIFGEPPEILLLPKCHCPFACDDPMEHQFIANRTKIFALLRRVQSELNPMKITVIINIKRGENQKIITWLTEELEKENLLDSINVTTIGQCRGLEFPVLVTLTCSFFGDKDGYHDSTAIDAWTRATTSLFIIHPENNECQLSKTLKNALENGLVKKAKEQDDSTEHQDQDNTNGSVMDILANFFTQPGERGANFHMMGNTIVVGGNDLVGGIQSAGGSLEDYCEGLGLSAWKNPNVYKPGS